MRSALVLAALLAGVLGVSAATGNSETPGFDLVLDGERALVSLFPPLADFVDYLLQLAALICDAVPLVPLLARRVDVPPLQFVEYTRGGARVVSAAALRTRTREALFVPGWGNSPRDAAARALVTALLSTHQRVLVLDTRAAFLRGYVGAVSRVPALAAKLSEFMLTAAQRGTSLRSWHLVGFSLGAHVAAAAGSVTAAAGVRLGRLTALEPARPCVGDAARWRRGADLVTVVHSSRALALRHAVGHADVYVGGKGWQGCGAACQHATAWRLWALSAKDSGVLRARRCGDWAALAAGNCSGPAAALGVHCDTKPRGIYLYTPPPHLAPHSLPLIDLEVPFFDDERRRPVL